MKKILLILALTSVLLSCSSDDNDGNDVAFHMTKVSGGFAGVNETFKKGDIIWTLNDGNSTLVIAKNTTKPYSGLDDGVYSYAIEIIDGKQYFHINQIEFGGLTNGNATMTINENERSGGQGADGFIFEFERN